MKKRTENDQRKKNFRNWKRITLAAALTASCISLSGCGALQAIVSEVGWQMDRNAKTEIATNGYDDVETLDDGLYLTEEAEYDSFFLAGAAPVSKGYGDIENPWPDWNTEEYSYQQENAWMSVKTSPFSTFAADVDTASYANLRRMILRGERIPADAIRIEEIINYFSYDYPEPQDGEPFSVTTEIAPCPWNENTQLLLIGLQAKKMEQTERPASNLVFLVDVSGSMDEYNKLPLVQQSMHLLTESLGPEDRVSIVTYASGDKVVLEGVSGENQAEISSAMEDLMAGGGTNGSAGIQTAYEIAEKYFIPDGNNRIILATDGDLNIGITDEGSLTRLIQEKAKSGVYLSVLGFGTGNISDTNMEALADHGNGNYSYIDSVSEARKVLIEEMGQTLFTVAKDVKLQVEFNPEKIKGYRLIGYENRVMAAEDFADDTKDGGEIGAGHRVTALYEIAKTDSAQKIPEVVSRYGNNGQAAVETVSAEASAEEGDSVETLAESKTVNEVTEHAMDEAEEPNTADEAAGTEQDGLAASVSEDELLAVNIRCKEPDGDESRLFTYPVTTSQETETMSENLSWAAGVAQVGMLLKESEYSGTSDFETVLERLEALESVKNDDYRQEFLYLVKRVK